MKLELTGISDLLNALDTSETMSEARKVVRDHGAKLNSRMVRHASFRGHYEGNRFVPPTGMTKRSITIQLRDSGLTVAVRPNTHYSPYLEYGTRYMAAQPFIKPALDEVKQNFIDAIAAIRGSRK